MYPIILFFATVFLFSLWLIRQARARRQVAENAALLAQLEVMEASFNRLEFQFEDEFEPQNPIPQVRKQKKRQKPKQPHSQSSAGHAPPDEPSVTTTTHTSQKPTPTSIEQFPPTASNPPQISREEESVTPITSTSPTPSSSKGNRNPKRRQGTIAAPKTYEEYEAARKLLPPPPRYIPNARLMSLLEQVGSPAPPTLLSSSIREDQRPSVVEKAERPKSSLFNTCLKPLQFVTRCVVLLAKPALRITRFLSNFLTRPKPPPPPISSTLSQNRAA